MPIVLNAEPVLIDSSHLVYSYHPSVAILLELYEGGKKVINYSGDVSDLYTGVTPPGCFRTNIIRGQFQLGSTPCQMITCDKAIA